MDTDLIMILKMKQGSDDASEAFVRKYYGDILKYCYFHCPDRSLAQDLTQEVFLKFFQCLSRYDHRGKAKNYLYTIAGNLCRDQFRSPPPVLPEPENPPRDAQGPEERLALESVVRSLPEELREVILLHYYQDLKLREVASVLNIGLPLTKYRLKKAKELLRKELEDGTE